MTVASSKNNYTSGLPQLPPPPRPQGFFINGFFIVAHSLNVRSPTATPRPPLRCPPYEDPRQATRSRASSVNSHQGGGGSRGKRREARAPINPSSKQLDLDETKILNPDLRRWRPFLRRRRLGSPRPSRSLAACSWGKMPQETPLSSSLHALQAALCPPRLSMLDLTLPPAV